MKPRVLVLALIAALGTGCGSMDAPGKALRMEQVLSIRHGAPNAQSYYQMGRYFHGQIRLALAEEAYLKAVAADEAHVDALNALGSLYAERGELERATQMFEKVTALAPDAAYLYNNLGFAYFLQGRQDQAYAAVRKALLLDKTFERAWINLARIAGMRSEPGLIEAVALRRLEALPTEFAAVSIPEWAGSEQPIQAGSPGMKTADAAAADGDQHEVEKALTTVANTAARTSPPVQADENRIAGGRFILVSPSREVVSNGETIEIASLESAISADTPDRNPTMPTARLEVSNGNGVARFARTFSARLKDKKISVSRITNLGSFALKTTVIEYQPGYEEAARALQERAKLSARLIPAIRSRPGSDIRIVLGRDALQFG